jgi:NADH:ubiquinone oxidoreductase subunit 4 (subunit M)
MTPVLTILTAIPAAAAVLALFSGNRASTARAVALIAGLVSLALAVRVWLGIGTDGSMKFVERAGWVPGLGIEYHLGVDGL